MTSGLELTDGELLDALNDTAMARQAACGYPSPRNLLELARAAIAVDRKAFRAELSPTLSILEKIMNTNETAPVFELRSGQKLENLEILIHVAQNQPCSFQHLRGQFSQSSIKGFKVRLNHLVYSQQLQADKSGSSMESWTFALGEMAGKIGRELSAPAQAKPQAKAPSPEPDGQDETHEPPALYVGVIAPPREPAVMTGPTYCPKPMQAMRPGSDDFTRMPSLQQGRRLPFTGGYVGVTGSQS